MQKDTTVELGEMMFKVMRLMKEEMSYTDSFVHLSILQIHTLFYINRNKDKQVTMSDIAKNFNIELPSATSLINKLCDQKFAERYFDLKDRRLVLIRLTRDGEKLMEQAATQRNKKIEKFLSYLSEKEKSDLLNIFKTLYNGLQS
jgi:DNA-binding MarR family transcriptional regulator